MNEMVKRFEPLIIAGLLVWGAAFLLRLPHLQVWTFSAAETVEALNEATMVVILIESAAVLAEVDEIAAVEGVSLTCDPTFEPCRLSVIRSRERGPAKFPFGEVVATQGAAAALHEAGEHPFVYLQRHAHGDWGELDAEDVAENELSLVQGFRLLSAYTLKDGTRIWIITEADRSVTTILLPSEY